jgi:hypothetical protein
MVCFMDNKEPADISKQLAEAETKDILMSLTPPFLGGLTPIRRKWLLAAGLTLVLLLSAVLFRFFGQTGFSPPEPALAGEITIKALAEDETGIDVDTAFLLTSENPLAGRTVTETLKIRPDLKYTLEKRSGGKEYKILPAQNLIPDTIYRLSFDPTGQERDNYSWAFQTKGQFRVLRTLPGNRTTGVPLNTGIEITYSHENFDLNRFQDCFSLSPRAEGRFEKHKKTAVFVPRGLKPATIYTVTVKKGLPLAETGETLGEDYSFSFETVAADGEPETFTFDLDNRLTEFAVGESPVFPAYFYSQGQAPSVRVSLYRYADHKAFAGSLARRDEIPQWSYMALNRYREDFSGLNKQVEFDLDFLNTDSYNHYVVFPEPLPAGYYAADLKAGEAVRQIWFQVTDLAVYRAQGEESSLFWVNDLKTGTPARNVQVLVADRNTTAKADAAGAVLIRQALAGAKRTYALVKSEDREILVPLEPVPGFYQESSARLDYWKYLYLDRELFRPGDTVHYWGVLAPRSGTGPARDIVLELWGGAGPLYEGAPEQPILSRKISLAGNTFTGEVKLPVLKPGYYWLAVKTGDATLLSRGFSVDTYQKPAYRLTVTPTKRAVFAGEVMSFQVQAAFFEGTPLPGLNLSYHVQSHTGTITSDDRGEAGIPYTGTLDVDYYSPYTYANLWLNATLPEAGEITESGEVLVFKGKVALSGEAEQKGDTFTLLTRLTGVDLGKINAGDYVTPENFLTGPVPEGLIEGKIYQDVWTKRETGQYYDFINKRVEKVYNYRHSTKLIGNFSLVTGSDGTAAYSGKLEPGNSYYLELATRDSDGRQVRQRVEITGSGENNSPGYRDYRLGLLEAKSVYLPGETVRLAFQENARELSPRDNSFLFFRGQKQLDAYAVGGNARYSFDFAAEYIPNVMVYGVYFDGRSYWEASSLTVAFARETRELRVQVNPDKKEYRPGEKVKLAVRVTDKNDKPVPARINLNLVDEALYSLAAQEVDLLNSLYGDYMYPYLSTRKSHDHPGASGGAEKGGEGESERRDFRDTVLFTSRETGGDGKAAVEFQLPDNLTSWRVTYHAVTPGLEAGSGTCQIPVRLPFFVEMTLNSVCLEGDTPAIVLRSFGEKLAARQPVSYRMKLVAPGGEALVRTGKGEAFTSFDWVLPGLKAGSYTLSVTAEGAGYEDTLTREITVVKSLLERTVSTSSLLREGIKLEGAAEEPTTLVFSDYEKSQYLAGLYRLAWVNGSRLEQQLAAREARKLLARYFPAETEYPDAAGPESPLNYQQADGGIAILPYGESDLALSALIASCDPGDFDRNALAGYFYHVLEQQDAGEDPSLALWGLAALNEPVLLQSRAYLQEKNLEPAVKINLASALLAMGDGAYGQQVFQELLSRYGEDLGTTMRIKGSRDQDEMIEATGRMALLAARLDLPEKHKLYQYLLENPGEDILNTLEQLEILKYNLRYMNPAPVAFSYDLDGKTVRKTLTGQESFLLTLLPEQRQSLKFSGIQGRVGVTTTYTGPYKAGETGSGQDLSLSRTYYVNGQKTNRIQRSDLVQVVVHYEVGNKAPGGLYEVVDVLPAGLRYVSRPYSRVTKPTWDWDYPAEVKGQKLTFAVTKGGSKLTYYARVVSPGEFVAQAPLLGSISSKIYTTGNQDRIVIQ